ncbi:MAG: winged helix-turn-helix domain-containing protein [Kangiellaceae bacterium]|nr:winged helix-turn-helix domain-containing protein [Kangiellaceae bacterium]MCW8999203.1 winged helix-turn-helix domain-containing protein [Kangiellaceae bacterium]
MPNKGVTIGEFKLDLVSKTLTNANNETFPLNWKTFSVLKLLFDNQNEIVTREEMIKAIWEDNFPVGDKALTTAIWNLRKVLDKSSVSIETVPKKGYRLAITSSGAEVLVLEAGTEVETEVEKKSVVEKPAALDGNSNENHKPKSQVTTVKKLISILVLVLLASAWWFLQQRESDFADESSANRIVVFSRGSIKTPDVEQFVLEIENLIKQRANLELLDSEFKHQILQSQSKQEQASQLGVTALIYIEVNRLTQEQVSVSVKVVQVQTNGFETKSWQVKTSELFDLIPSILTMLPAGDWQ